MLVMITLSSTEFFSRFGDDVLLANPKEFFGIERRRRLIDVSDVEQFDHFLDAEDLLVAVRPAEPNEVIEHGLRQVALLLVFADIHSTMTLRQLGAIRPEDHR